MSAVTPDFKKLSKIESSRHIPKVPTPQSKPQNNESRQSFRSVSLASTVPENEQQQDEHRNDVFNVYLQETNLLSVLNSWIVLISGLDDLPYNPYPTLVWYTRRHAERFHMFKEDEDTISKKFDVKFFRTGINVTRTHDDPPWWGVQMILKAVNTKDLEPYHSLLAKCTFSYPDLEEDDQYSVYKPVAVLVGPCVFVGSLYHEVPLVQVRLEHAISGPSTDHAIKMFSLLVIHAVKKMENDHGFLLFEVFVPHYNDLTWNSSHWSTTSIIENEDEFISLVQNATKSNKFVVCKCLFMMDHGREKWQRGEVQLHFNFIKVQKDRTISQASIPFRSAFEGIFSTNSSFVNYLSWFENVQRPQKTPEFRQPTASTITKGGRNTKSKQNRQSSDTMYVPPHINDSDGASTVSSYTDVYPEEGLYAKAIQDNIREFLSHMVSSLPGEKNLFPMLHYIILLLLIDRNEEGLVEASRLLQSTLYGIHLFMQKNTILQGMMAWFSDKESEQAYVVQTFFLQLCQHFKGLFQDELRERSNDFDMFGRVLLDKLEFIQNTSHSYRNKELASLPLSPEVIEELKSINRYCTTIMFGAIDDALDFCPTLKSYFPSIATAGQSLNVSYKFQHGVESLPILAQDKMYMNREKAKKAISSPSIISNQATILKYFVDAKIDQVFQVFLSDVLNGRFLRPNPYPSLVTHLRSAAISMELFREKKDKLISRLVPESSQIVDTQNHIYTCPGLDAYGMKSAVACLDIKYYTMLLSKMSGIQNTVNTRVTDAGIRATIGFALTGFSPWYGRVMPYIHQIDVEEHYFLQGPSNSKMDVINYFTRLVYDHLVGIAEESSILFVGFFLGDLSVRLSLLDIVPAARKISFLSQLMTTVKSEKPVFMKAYILIDWRLVLVQKSFVLHYIHGQFQGYQRFFKQRPLSYYQNVFSSQIAASLFARSCGPQDRSNPMEGENLRTSSVHVDHAIKNAWYDGNIQDAFRWALMRSLMSQSTMCVAEAWYMSQSAAGQLEYLIILNKTLQNLVYEELSKTFTPYKQEKEEIESLLDMAVLGDMTHAYLQKLDKVLQRPTCMAPSGLLNQLHETLNLVTERLSLNNKLRLKIHDQTPLILESVNELLQPLLDACAHDVIQVCPDINQVIR